MGFILKKMSSDYCFVNALNYTTAFTLLFGTVK